MCRKNKEIRLLRMEGLGEGNMDKKGDLGSSWPFVFCGYSPSLNIYILMVSYLISSLQVRR